MKHLNELDKEAAGRMKRQKEAARLTERKNKTQTTGNNLQEEESKTAGSVFRLKPKGNPKYFTSASRPRDPKKKSEITLYNVRAVPTRVKPAD
jgi:hypothetical protein